MTLSVEHRRGGEERDKGEATGPGIVVSDGRLEPESFGGHPRIAAFIWGGKVRPAPTLPFGRWKGAA